VLRDVVLFGLLSFTGGDGLECGVDAVIVEWKARVLLVVLKP
jgi:hypothetical protein